MKITKEVIKNGINFKLDGRLDTSTSDQLDTAINKIGPDVKVLHFDFAKLEYVSSSGLRVLLSAQKMMNARNGELVIYNANKVVKEVFDITGFSSFIKFE